MTSPPAFFHADSDAVRLRIPVGAAFIGATIGSASLHDRFEPMCSVDDALAPCVAQADEIHAAVRRRVAGASRRPVMLREWNLRPAQAAS